MVIAQTPLLGDENTPLHLGASGGTGFEGATPRHQVAYTPNPLATPRQVGPDGLATPRGDGQSVVGATPLRTPMRDNLSINPEGQFSMVGDTPREQRIRATSAKSALRAGFMNLPKPENNFELLVPEDEDAEDDAGATVTEEDAAERDARLKWQREELERKALARRSQVVQQGLPRPANVEVEGLIQRLRISDDGSAPEDEATQLVHREMVQLLEHDSIAHPIPGTSRPGGTRSSYAMPQDEDIDVARTEIRKELATSLGYPDANDEQVKQGITALVGLEDVDASFSWSTLRQRLAFDVNRKTWVEPESLSTEERIAGFSSLLNQSRDAMAVEAQKAAKAEKKLGVMLGGYQARSKALVKRVVDGFEELQKTQLEFDSFSQLRTTESATGPARVSSLKEEVEKLERREHLLQGRYAELDGERRELVSRVSTLEEKLMAEAEALNEAALAEMEQEQDAEA